MISKLINYINWRFSPTKLVALFSGNEFFVYFKQNEYGRKSYEIETREWSKDFVKFNTYEGLILTEWLNDVKFDFIPSYKEIKNGIKEVYVERYVERRAKVL